ncbi:MAG: hypothetical protein J1E85_10055 [Ruminococcus sp.]|nr:hypothetical protein [Ruminococcus sp.]
MPVLDLCKKRIGRRTMYICVCQFVWNLKEYKNEEKPDKIWLFVVQVTGLEPA